jgi:hypothetical protein
MNEFWGQRILKNVESTNLITHLGHTTLRKNPCRVFIVEFCIDKFEIAPALRWKKFGYKLGSKSLIVTL